jgi:hypothetical protein
MRAARALGPILIAAACGVVGLQAWVPIKGEPWPDGRLAVAVEMAATAPAGSVADWDGAAAEAMAAWNAGLQRVQLAPATATGKPWYDNGRNEMFFDVKIYDEFFPNGVLAVTFNAVDRGVLVESDIVFNASLRWSVYRGPLQRDVIDFRRVAIHELGHFLGLDHPDEAGQTVPAIMNSVVGAQEVPTGDDLAGARALYDRGNGAPPIIVGLSRATTGYQGGPVQFEVAAGGRGPLRYAWRREGVAVPGGTAAVLAFDAVALADAGNYTVVVTSPAGSATSPPVVLTVVPAEPPVASVAATSVTLTAGETMALRASVGSGGKPMTFRWSKGGKVIAQGLVTDTGSASFSLPDAQLDDAGDYTLILANAAATVTLPAVRATVLPGRPPVMTADLPTRAVDGSIVLQAPVLGSPPLRYQWKKDGVDISGATQGTFRISEIGNYSVTVANSFGQATSSGRLTFLGRGTLGVTKHPQPITALAGSAVGFDADYTGSGAIRWFKDGVALNDSPLQFAPNGQPFFPRIQGARQRELRISDIGSADAGDYAFEISDGTQTVRSRGARLTLFIPQKPAITWHPSHHNVAPGATVNLEVTVRPTLPEAFGLNNPNAQPPRFQWLRNGAPVAGATRAAHTFVAQVADAGAYRVQVSNESGVTDSEPAEVVVTPGAASLLPVQLGAKLFDRGDDSALRLMEVALEIWRRRNSPVVETVVWRRISPSPATGVFVFYPYFTPGLHTLTVTRGGVSETSRPVLLDYAPPIVPLIVTQPRAQVLGAGEGTTLGVNAVAYDALRFQWSKDGANIPAATNSSLTVANFSADRAGGYRVAVTGSLGTTLSETAVLELRPVPAPAIVSHPLGQTVTAGTPVTLDVSAASENGTLRYQWLRDGQPMAGATRAQHTFASAAIGDSAGYSVRVNDDAGAVTSITAQLRVLAANRPPEILFPPASQIAILGGDATLSVGAEGAPLPDRYQWRKDGVDIPGATGAKLRLQGVQPEQAGSYSVVAYSANGSVVSTAATLTVDVRARLVNLATRASVGVSADVLIAGFVVSGTQPRQVLVRAIGDQLGEFGVQGVLRNPFLRLFDSKSVLLRDSDDWSRATDLTAAVTAAAREVGAFPMRLGSRDSAILQTLAPGSYTAQVSGIVDTTGVALVEIYEVGAPAGNRLVNLSSRAVVGTGANILIPGLVLSGQAPRRLLFRAVGPGLAELGVAGPLADPVMKVLRGDDVIAQNDNWGDQPGAAALTPAMAAVGAFPLRAGSRDAALLLDLPPGSYTVQVSGAGGATGVALVEVYEAAP